MLLPWSNGKSGWELANIVEWYFGCSHWVGTFNRNKDPSVEIFNNQVYRKSNNWRLWSKREMDRHYEAIYTTIIGMKTLCTQNQWESKEIVSAHNTQLKISWNTTQCTFFPILFPHLDDECNLYIFINRIHPFTHKEATNPTMAKPSLLLHFFIFFFFFFMILPCLSCPECQRQALLQFKSSTLSIYSSLHALDSWEFSSSCCLWDGVICSTSPPNSTSRAVIALHLSDLFIGSLLENLELFPSSILAPLFFY